MNLYIKSLGQGQSLVFFHGWGFDHSIWDTLALKLQAKFKLHLVDLPGFGNSDLMSWDEFKIALFQQLPDKFKVIGWSLGGLHAMRLAVEEQNRVTGMLITTSSPRFIKEPGWPGVGKEVFQKFYNNLSDNPQQTIREFIDLQLQNHDFRPVNQFKSSMEGLSQGLEILGGWDLRDALLNYKKPACFIFGRLDAITPRSTLTVMEKLYPDFKHILIPKAAHIPFLSHEQEYLKILEQFLK